MNTCSSSERRPRSAALAAPQSDHAMDRRKSQTDLAIRVADGRAHLDCALSGAEEEVWPDRETTPPAVGKPGKTVGPPRSKPGGSRYRAKKAVVFCG